MQLGQLQRERCFYKVDFPDKKCIETVFEIMLISNSSPCGETVESSHFQNGWPRSKDLRTKLAVIGEIIQITTDYKRLITTIRLTDIDSLEKNHFAIQITYT